MSASLPVDDPCRKRGHKETVHSSRRIFKLTVNIFPFSVPREKAFRTRTNRVCRAKSRTELL